MNESIRSFKRALDRAAFSMFRFILRTRKGNKSKTFAIVRTDGIGDLVFFLPFCAELKKHFSTHRFVLVCRREAAPLAGNSIFDTVIAYGYMQYRRNYFYRLWILLKIRSVHPSLTLYASYHRQHIGDEMALLSGANRVIAFDGNDEIIHPSMRESNSSFYSAIVRVEDHSPEKEKYRTLFAKMDVRIDEVERTRARLFGRESPGRKGADSYVLLTPGGSSRLRRWPWERFAELGDILAAQTGVEIILCGNRGENGLLSTIAKRMKKTPPIISDLSIQSVVELIKRASMVVGNESGLLHIAASVGTPAICILGGGHFSRYFPYGSTRVVNYKLDCYECNWKCPFPEAYCLTRISVEDVMGEVERVIGA